ncbi:GntR family transcriptional regulator [Bradyrhizobium sp. WD16]|uniref:GntR family transcriptional regulator n=1 Tax=Bradyrhizobium sp. WD16 TaxID=1521768 RepID=UPI0020A39392|nr:GntR family transcriptional regulator [Bradyrhizobium sp. WD16]UTD26761.1 GntR family transcriptional regulator [Bradyrhizobium sp. WD16]
MSEQSPRRRGRPRKAATIDKTVGQHLRLRRTSLHERAVERLRELIIRGDLAQGTELVEAELCALIGVSRTPLREALKLLAASGLVELRQNRSARVAVMKRDEILSLFETLSGIERHAAELAAVRMEAEDLGELTRMQDEMEQQFAGRNIDVYFALNHALHQAIVAGTRNPLLSETHQWLIARAEWARYSALRSRQRWDESVREHRDILAALTARDATAAGRLLAQHVMNTGFEVVQALSDREASPQAGGAGHAA